MEFEFLTVSNPNDIKTRQSQRVIRRQAGRTKSRRQAKENSTGGHGGDTTTSATISISRIDENENGLASARARRTAPWHHQQQRVLPSTQAIRSTLQPLGAGLGLNPMQRLPIEANSNTNLLIEFALHESKNNFRPMFYVWLSICLDNDIGMNIFLSDAAATLYTNQADHEPQQILQSSEYYTRSLQQLTTRLQDPVKSMSEAVIATILSIACLDARNGRLDQWMIHIRGLKQIITARGGLGTLSTSHPLLLSLFWSDMNGCLLEDIPPHFEIPWHILDLDFTSPVSPILGSLIQSIESVSGTLSQICSALTSLANSSQFMNDRGGFSSDIFTENLHYYQIYLVVLYEVLHLPRYGYDGRGKDEGSEFQLVHEIVRLAILLYLSLVKRRFKVAPCSIEAYRTKLLRLLEKHPVDWSSFRSLQLWVFTIHAIATPGYAREQIVMDIGNIMRHMGIWLWADAAEIIKGISWIEQIAPHQLELLEHEIMQYQMPPESV